MFQGSSPLNEIKGPKPVSDTEMRSVTLLVVLSLRYSHIRGLRIDKSTAAYEDVVDAIHPSVEPDERIIDNIEALFRSASTFLHRATHGLVHFGSVTIAVPDTWPARPQAKSTTANLFPVADVRVAAENPQYGDTPYTLQPRGCGERGEYVHLTPRFLGELNDSIAEVYGSPAYLLVHEWAHFRYGVFDEYGDPESYRYPSLYCEFGKVRASTCSQRHKFEVYTDSGEPCRIYKGCRVSSKCKARFLQNSKDPVISSIMFMPYIDGVSDFCDKDGDKRHNAHAPNKHNHLCGRKSTWEVISDNEDFKGLASADLSKKVDVTFTEVQKREGTIGRVIFALDLSSSMSRNNRIGHLKDAASHSLREIIPDGLEVGLVTFSSSAHVEAPLTTVQQSTREQLVAKVQQLRENGFTCIGCALRQALEMFQENKQSAAGSVIILMSDGEENGSPRIEDVMDELIAHQVVVNTIAFGTEAAEKLEELALRTGGKPFALHDGQYSAPIALVSAFLDSTAAMVDDDKKPVVIFARAAKIVDKREFAILVDADLGNWTTIEVQSSKASDLEVELRYPDGKTCQDCLESGPAKSGSYITFHIPGVATPGTWTLVVSRKTFTSSAPNVHVRATSLAGNRGKEPVLVHAFLKKTEVNSATEAVIYAEVTKGTQVVLHAKVTATCHQAQDALRGRCGAIRRWPRYAADCSPKWTFLILGADVTANDGIYSGYFTQFNGVGRYSVSARVVSSNDSVIVPGRKASGGLPAPQLLEVPAVGTVAAAPTDEDGGGIPLDHFVYVDQDIEEAEPQVVSSEKAPQFERHAEGGSFRLGHEIDGYTIPPGSIQDLSVEDSFVDDNGEHVVLLAWTCPGAHLNSGNASRVELRASTLLSDLIRDFDSALEIRDNSTEDGHITPGAVGSRQRQRFSVPDELLAVARKDSLLDFYFASRVWNDVGLSSPVSNIARVTFQRPPPLAGSTNGLPTWAIALIVVASMIAVVAVGAAVIMVVKRRSSE
ncbi:calcium-activated chloride channel regulator 3A-1-like [Dermacentor silvarum]|uniref:calcium-activated chloride channel regulator 3A-1-like n=1 Tax=Dermacentor silvarum TaxID=543639 RepID=UPI002101134D|nr:calcium-activated chloride channel regulator 3A-1-like [Dermacentor silvarum]